MRNIYQVEYITAGGCHGTVMRNLLETAESTFASFVRQGASVRLIQKSGDKSEIIKEVING